MHLSPRISELLQAYRNTEPEGRRGPRFKELALAIEKEIPTRGVSDTVLLECFGLPDLWSQKHDDALFVYFFDQETPGRDRDEWYFHLKNGKVTESGYNRRGINDLSCLKSRRHWPQRDA